MWKHKKKTATFNKNPWKCCNSYTLDTRTLIPVNSSNMTFLYPTINCSLMSQRPLNLFIVSNSFPFSSVTALFFLTGTPTYFLSKHTQYRTSRNSNQEDVCEAVCFLSRRSHRSVSGCLFSNSSVPDFCHLAVKGDSFYPSPSLVMLVSYSRDRSFPGSSVLQLPIYTAPSFVQFNLWSVYVGKADGGITEVVLFLQK